MSSFSLHALLKLQRPPTIVLCTSLYHVVQYNGIVIYDTHHPKPSASCMSSKQLNGPCLTSRSAFTRPRSINVTSPSLLTWGCGKHDKLLWSMMINVSTRTMEWVERCRNFVQTSKTLHVNSSKNMTSLHAVHANNKRKHQASDTSKIYTWIPCVLPLCFIIQGRAGDYPLWMLPMLEASKVGLSKATKDYLCTFYWFLSCEMLLSLFKLVWDDLPFANVNAESANQNIARSKASMFLARPVEGIPTPVVLRRVLFAPQKAQAADCCKGVQYWITRKKIHDTAIGCDRHLCNAAIVRHRWRATFNRQSMPCGLQWSSCEKGRLQACIWNSR